MTDSRIAFKRLSAAEALRARYIDFEGEKNKLPVLLSVPRRAGKGSTPFVHQDVVDVAFASLGVPAMSPTRRFAPARAWAPRVRTSARIDRAPARTASSGTAPRRVSATRSATEVESVAARSSRRSTQLRPPFANRRIIGGHTLADPEFSPTNATPLRASGLPKHVRCQLRHTPTGFMLRNHT
jgi:hypothetical protein